MTKKIIEFVFTWIISLVFIIIAFMIVFRIAYNYGNEDGLKKAYRIEMFKKYPEYFQDWNEYNAEVIEKNDNPKIGE